MKLSLPSQGHTFGGAAGTGTVGPGTVDILAKFSGADTVVDSLISESGSNVLCTGHFLSASDNFYDFGSVDNRWATVRAGKDFGIVGAQGDTTFTARLGSGYLKLGVGGSTATDITISRDADGNLLLIPAARQVAFASAAKGLSDTVGYLCIPGSAGAPSGTPSNIPTGQVPYQVDTTNNKLYIYNGGWKKAQVAGVDVIFG